MDSSQNPRPQNPDDSARVKWLVPQKPGSGDRAKSSDSFAGFSGENFTEDTSLTEILGVIRRRYIIILACISVITVICATIVFQLTPLYSGESELLIDQGKTQILDIRSVVSQLPADATSIRSEVDVLQSADIAEAVVKKTNLLTVPEFNSRLPHSLGIGIFWVPFQWTVSAVKSLFVSSSSVPDDPERAELVSVIGALQSRTSIVNDGKTFVLKIFVASEDPKLAATLADAYADAYLNAQLEAKFQAAQRASTWLNDHLLDLRSKTEATDQAVQEFAAAHNLTATTNANVTSQQISELNTQLVLASADLAQKKAALQQVRTSLNTGGVSAAAQVLSSPLIQALREQESVLLTQEANLATRYKPEHPAIINIKAQIRDMNLKIQDEIDRIAHGMAGDVVAAQAKVDSLHQSLTDLQSSPQNDAQVQLRELQREADANRAIYEDFLNRFKQTSAQEDIQEPDARIVSHAMIPTTPSYPKRMSLIGIAFFGSIMVGVFAAFGREHLDVGFRTSEQFEKMMHMPVLGLEPDLPSSEPPQDVVVRQQTSPYAEAIQSIRMALRYSDVDNPPKVVLVTSSLSDEGKTVFAISLARSAAKSGLTTLLIDCDLRRPSLAKLFNVDSKPGLLAFFDDNADKSDIIYVDQESGLHFITAPSGTPNPQDLLGSKHMKTLIDGMRFHYDFIVLDTPPLLAVSDALALSHAADATLFLVRWAKSPRKIVRVAMKSFHALGGKLAGVVLSRVDMHKHAKYGYGNLGYYTESYGRNGSNEG